MCRKLSLLVLIWTELLLFTVAFDLQVDIPDDWEDPHDMANFDYSSIGAESEDKKPVENRADDGEMHTDPSSNDPNKPHALLEEPKPSVTSLESVSLQESSCKHPFLHRFVSLLYKRLRYVGAPPDVTDYDLSLHLDSRNWLTLENFSGDCQSNVPEVTRVFEEMITDVHIHIQEHNTWVRQIEDVIHISFADFCKLSMVVLVAVSVLTMQAFSRISWPTQIKRIFIIAFLISFAMTYIHEIKLAEAEYRSKSTEIPKECLEGEKDGWMSTVWSIYTDMFSLKKDPCAEYHKNILVEPHITVTPTKVIAVTLTRFAVEPMEHIGTAFSKAFKNMFADLPVTLWIPAFVIVVLVILGFLLIVAVCFGYNFSFNLPFWAGLQMGPQQVIQPHPEMDRMLEDRKREIDDLKATILKLKDRLQQQALPAPTVSPGRAARIANYLGFGKGENPPHNASNHPPYPPRQTDRASPPYPPQDPTRSNPPYPEFRPPPYPRDASELPSQDFDVDEFEGAGDSILRKRHVRSRTKLKSNQAQEEAPSYYPDSQTRPVHMSLRGVQQVSDGQNPIGFEHLMEQNEDIDTNSKMTRWSTTRNTEHAKSLGSVSKPVTAPVVDVVVNSAKADDSPSKAFTSLSDTKEKRGSKLSKEKDEAAASKVGSADNTTTSNSEEDWEEVGMDEKDHKTISDRMTSAELEDIFQRET